MLGVPTRGRSPYTRRARLVHRSRDGGCLTSAPVCPVHHRPMKLYTKNGSSWWKCSALISEGPPKAWCNQKFTPLPEPAAQPTPVPAAPGWPSPAPATPAVTPPPAAAPAYQAPAAPDPALKLKAMEFALEACRGLGMSGHEVLEVARATYTFLTGVETPPDADIPF